ncbi:MAG: acetate--CoA ligase family protein [Deltaproteobacteria bacterium]|nr:acetate--CoA ligase family protein [Deltaproteobacteria bacterium]
MGSIKEALLKLSQLMAGFPQIKGIDINPLIVLEKGKGSMAVDARII